MTMNRIVSMIKRYDPRADSFLLIQIDHESSHCEAVGNILLLEFLPFRVTYIAQKL